MTEETLQPRYELTHFDGIEIHTTSIVRAELEALDITSVDHFQSRCLGQFSFQPVKGNRIEYQGKWPMIGPVCLAILHAIQLNPGDFLNAQELAKITGVNSLKNKGVLTARVMKLREAHHEKGHPWFIDSGTSGGYHIRWPEERTWMWLERISAS